VIRFDDFEAVKFRNVVVDTVTNCYLVSDYEGFKEDVNLLKPTGYYTYQQV
jgi:hypothetical protein